MRLSSDRRLHPSPYIYVASSPLHGRGVFAAEPIHQGDVIEECPIIRFPAAERDLVGATLIDEYYFEWDGDGAVALGFGSLYNHSDTPVAEYIKDTVNDRLVIRAISDIAAEEEITFHYSGPGFVATGPMSRPAHGRLKDADVDPSTRRAWTLTGDDATYVLIPGAGGSAWYWHLVDAELRRRGHDVVVVDLPADDDNAGLLEYTDTVVDAIGDRTNLVLIAQSMAGFTAPLVAERVPVSLIVLVNAMIPAPNETAGDWWANTGHAQAMRENDERGGRPPGAGPGDPDFDLMTYFLHDVPQNVIDAGEAHQRGQSNTPFGQRWRLSAWPDVPTRVLTARDDRFFPADFQRRVAQDRLGITPDEMAGGHLVALSHPGELADTLEAYVAGATHRIAT